MRLSNQALRPCLLQMKSRNLVPHLMLVTTPTSTTVITVTITVTIGARKIGVEKATTTTTAVAEVVGVVVTTLTTAEVHSRPTQTSTLTGSHHTMHRGLGRNRHSLILQRRGSNHTLLPLDNLVFSGRVPNRRITPLWHPLLSCMVMAMHPLISMPPCTLLQSLNRTITCIWTRVRRLT